MPWETEWFVCVLYPAQVFWALSADVTWVAPEWEFRPIVVG